MSNEGPSRMEAWAAWAALLLTLIGATLTLWGKVSAHTQQLQDLDGRLATMQGQLDRIESRIIEKGNQ